MPKLYYPTPDELQGAKPLWEGGWTYDDNRGSWFDVYQELLVRLANTDYGRDLLCIDKYPYPVIFMRKNIVQFDMSRDLGPGYILSDVRIGAKWGNVIRYRWLAVKKALDQMNLEILLALPEYIIHDGRGVPMLRGASETTVYPDAGSGGSNTSVDGEVRSTGGTAKDWSVVRGEDPGEAAYDEGTEALPYILCHTDSNKFEAMRRCIFLFDSPAITASDVLLSATFQFTTDTVTDNQSDSSVLVQCTSASNTELVAGDYAKTGGSSPTRQAADIALSAINTDGSTYNEMALNAAGLASIEKNGITKFAVRSKFDADDDEPSYVQNQNVTRVDIATADVSGTSADPKLVIVHVAGFVPRAIIF